MKVYVILLAGEIQSKCFPSIMGVADEIGVHRNTLHQHFKTRSKYVGRNATVIQCELMAFKQRGKKSF